MRQNYDTEELTISKSAGTVFQKEGTADAVLRGDKPHFARTEERPMWLEQSGRGAGGLKGQKGTEEEATGR